MKNTNMFLQSELNKKLMAYTAGAGAAMLAGTGAHGAIVWEGGSPQDFGVGIGELLLTIEGVNHDLRFAGSSNPTWLSFYVNAPSNVARPGGVFGMISAGDAIDSLMTFGNFGYFYSNYYAGMMTRGDWDADGVTGYFGFRFELEEDSPNASAGTTVYGWAEVERLSPTSGRVLEWAYDDAGAPILAGAIPEPGTLGMLALGAVGLAAMRRRKSA